MYGVNMFQIWLWAPSQTSWSSGIQERGKSGARVHATASKADQVRGPALLSQLLLPRLLPNLTGPPVYQQDKPASASPECVIWSGLHQMYPPLITRPLHPSAWVDSHEARGKHPFGRLKMILSPLSDCTELRVPVLTFPLCHILLC